MVRLALVLVLVAANLGFLAWTQGWLAGLWPPPTHGEREPARLQAQVRPELIEVLTPKAASAALSAARAASMAAGEGPLCIEAGPLADAAAYTGIETTLTQAGIAADLWQRREATIAPVWAVHLGRFTSAEALRTKSDELRRQGVSAQEIGAPPELAPGLLLGRFESKEAAEAALPRFAERGVRGARVGQLTAAQTRLWLRFERADPALREQLKTLALPAVPGGFHGCGETR